ncbi:hypothetical protein L596_011942 [Steinernema carpocapsae]|uniref:Uncharacterized protein n=1 Tax=Steinernema carpocapsae TaxID=34508 RepID=A0A4U5NVT8_STECR|nr:hypothetical protein L596_011942 [Steinernema carpocapsae]
MSVVINDEVLRLFTLLRIVVCTKYLLNGSSATHAYLVFLLLLSPQGPSVDCQENSQFDQGYQQQPLGGPPQLPPAAEPTNEPLILALPVSPTALLVGVGSLGIVILLVILILSTETRPRDNRAEKDLVAIANQPPDFKERNMKKMYVQPPSTDFR